MEKILINTDYIKLQQLLKLVNIVSQGSDAKLLILNKQVKVNNQIVIERGKKVYHGDKIEIEDIGSFIVQGK